ncbi:MAG: type II toxin-antitoxin system RelE/ParE family toxin [Candidatus ainarchaeum sp.]|nr:type II toxin-antitoxin system RelE/ParE family toxin [Candidatus ainarchaeum sp.]
MTYGGRALGVRFVDSRLYEAYAELANGTREDKALRNSIEKAIQKLKENPVCGKRIQSGLWPKEYVRRYGINNLWKCNLLGGWRLVYTVVGDKVEIISVLLEWMSHKEYERRFGYKPG